MAVDRIKIQKKTNPSVTRTIQAEALKTFERRGWQAVPGDSAASSMSISSSSVPSGKKKDVEHVGLPAGENESGNANDANSGSDEPFSRVDGDTVEDNDSGNDESGKISIDALREEYQILSSKAADKRWSEKRLTEEISKLKPE